MSTNRVEQRRSKRIPTKMNLEVSSLFKQDNCVVRIIRQAEYADGVFNYGCEFVGMASVFDYIFEEIEQSAE